MELSEDQLKVLDNSIRNLRLALKNSVFYDPGHPLFTSSIDNFKTSLDKWFQIQDHLDLGISQDHLFLNGNSIKEKEGYYTEIANYLHMRGLLSLSLSRGIQLNELKNLFEFIRHDRKTIREKGGIQKNIPHNDHIKIKEIDYSSVLTAQQAEPASEEDKVWEFLFDIANESKKGELPSSKIEFLVDFLKDTKKSAATLNKVYKEAVEKLQDENAVHDIKSVIAQICSYFDSKSNKDAKEIKVKLMHVIGQLHPDLINTLFDQTMGQEQDMDLAEAITSDFSESYIAEFIESLISNEDSFNENLLKVFDKLAPDSARSDNVVSLVADKLFSKRVINPDTLTKLQMSIKEIFQRHPDSNFMNQIYKITVDSVVNKKIDTLVYVAKLTPLINKFVQSIEDGQLKKEEIWLLLNILWLENEAEEFKKFTDKLINVLPELLDSKDTERLKEIVEFFTEKTRPEQRKNKEMIKEIKEGLKKVTNTETLENLISIIPDGSIKDIDDIAYVLSKAETESAKLLLDAFLNHKNPAHRNKFRHVFTEMKDSISKEAVERFESCEPNHIKDLFIILKDCDPNKAYLVSKKLMTHKNPHIRWEALGNFAPKSNEDFSKVLKLYKKEKNDNVKKKAAAVLLKTGHADFIALLFKHCEKSWFNKKPLITLIELCGHYKIQESYIHLERIFLKRYLFNTKKRDEIRVAVISSVGRLQTEQSDKLIKAGHKDRSRRVREMSEIVQQLDG